MRGLKSVSHRRYRYICRRGGRGGGGGFISLKTEGHKLPPRPQRWWRRGGNACSKRNNTGRLPIFVHPRRGTGRTWIRTPEHYRYEYISSGGYGSASLKMAARKNCSRYYAVFVVGHIISAETQITLGDERGGIDSQTGSGGDTFFRARYILRQQ